MHPSIDSMHTSTHDPYSSTSHARLSEDGLRDDGMLDADVVVLVHPRGHVDRIGASMGRYRVDAGRTLHGSCCGAARDKMCDDEQRRRPPRRCAADECLASVLKEQGSRHQMRLLNGVFKLTRAPVGRMLIPSSRRTARRGAQAACSLAQSAGCGLFHPNPV